MIERMKPYAKFKSVIKCGVLKNKEKAYEIF